MIKMIAGATRVKTKETKPPELKTPADEPFTLSPEEEKHLVECGVAVYVEDSKKEPSTPPVDWQGIPEYHADMDAKTLRAIAKEMGLSFKANISRADMVKAMDEHMDQHMDETLPDEAPPSFDPAEAVK